MCLKGFCGYFSLYLGCVFIGVTGVIVAVLVFSVALFELIKDQEQGFYVKIIAMVFALVFGVGRVCLLFGTTWDRCWAIMFAFIIGLVSFALLIATMVFLCMSRKEPVYYLIGSILAILEVYNLWLILSTWWCCRSCTQDC
ncbi:uncharacterized protein [Drosophila kikkawai]|uniref:Uncharacterized protein n=1 Tax=Drosophila kikkawai TaxID=30033 RepID=A0A6P4JAD9_DROKI|nr:uncharacterized protein LOC108081092 [Drosophila kikkawai]KAH8304399.1 hypothetical protein KR059_008054 [Drosophila kikkawai]